MPIKRRGKEPSHNNLSVGILFCLFLLVIFAGSIALKVLDVVRKSTFDGKDRFTLAVSGLSVGQEKAVFLVSFSPEKNNVSILTIPSSLERNGVSLSLSAENVSRELAIPVDATVVAKKDITAEYFKSSEEERSLAPIIQSIVVNNGDFSTKNLTVLDLVRILFFAKSISPSAVQFSTLTSSDAVNIDQLSLRLFANATIASERLSIEIINGTGVGGLGNRLARYITNTSGNVVAVNTSKEIINTSEILYTGESSYTVGKLSKLLKFPAKKIQKAEISDIIIRIGKDNIQKEVF